MPWRLIFRIKLLVEAVLNCWSWSELLQVSFLASVLRHSQYEKLNIKNVNYKVNIELTFWIPDHSNFWLETLRSWSSWRIWFQSPLFPFWYHWLHHWDTLNFQSKSVAVTSDSHICGEACWSSVWWGFYSVILHSRLDRFLRHLQCLDGILCKEIQKDYGGLVMATWTCVFM